MKEKQNTAILILAAGASRRLGHPKQLVEYKGKTLLNNTIDICIKSKIGDIFLILGSNRKKIEKEMISFLGEILFHKDWKKGMGSTISFGVNSILKKGNYENIIITVADQPFLEDEILKKLWAKKKSQQAQIVISKYQKGGGPPTLFGKKYFSELIQLSGDEGAKSIIKKNEKEVFSVDFPLGNIDIDTPEDLKSLHLTS